MSNYSPAFEAIQAIYIEEYDYLLSLDPLSGITAFQDGKALESRIREWLDTPEGSVADMPWWGNQLARLKFEPQGATCQVIAETLILTKLPFDVNNLRISGIRVENLEADMIRVIIDCQTGQFALEARL